MQIEISDHARYEGLQNASPLVETADKATIYDHECNHSMMKPPTLLFPK